MLSTEGQRSKVTQNGLIQEIDLICHNQVWDETAFTIHFFLVPHIKITSHLPYCDPVLAYNDNTNRNLTLRDGVEFLYINL